MKFHYYNTIFQKILLVFLFSIAGFAQKNDTIPKEKLFKFEETFSIYYAMPNQLGNHTLAEDYKNSFGIGSRLTLVSIKNFNVGFGGEFLTYTVTNKSKAGNFSSANYYNAFILVHYPIQVANRITLTPLTALGGIEFTQREKGVRHSNQNGMNYRLGFSADYAIFKKTDIFLGLDYIYTKFKLNANPEIINYYGKSNNLQLSLGIKFR